MSVLEEPARKSRIRRIFDNRVVRLVVLFVAVVLADGAGQAALVNLPPLVPEASRDAVAILLPLAAALAVLAVYGLLVRLIEHRGAREIAPAKAPAGLIGGALIGVALFGIVMAILLGIGVAHVAATPGQSLTAAGTMAVMAAVGEELIVRGVLFRIVEEMFGSLVALVVSAAVFGAAHLANPGAALSAGIAIMLEAGLLLAVCYMLTRDLWLAIGLHFGWNFTEGGIFGAAVSGGQFKGLTHTTLTGPALLTGGAFGAEGSVVAVGACMLAAAVLFALALRRGQWRGLRLAINDPSTSSG
jgi:CAAX protease family protein